ncbi:Octopamine receptor beta-3R, partial [Zootermopsis nevadensis]
VMGTIIVAAVLGNALVIISVVRHRKLRIITNYYVVSLALADLLVALCAMTFNASVELTGGTWLFGYVMCDVWNSLDVYFSTASILHLCCISVDRYYAIVRPLEYPITMTHRTVCFMIANVWMLPALISFTPIFLGWYTTPEHQEFRKSNPHVCIFEVNIYYMMISSGVSFWIPGVVMVTMYYRIYKEAVRQRKALSRTSSNILLNSIHQRHTNHHHHHSHYLHPSDGDVTVPPGTVSSSANSRQSSVRSAAYGTTAKTATELNMNGCEEDCVYTSLRYLMILSISCFTDLGKPQWKSNLSDTDTHGSIILKLVLDINQTQPNLGDYLNCVLFAGTSVRQQSTSWRTEHKAARTLGIIMGAFMICWLPFFLWHIAASVSTRIYDVVVAVLFWIGYFNSALNPLIYAYFNRDFREAFKNTL